MKLPNWFVAHIPRSRSRITVCSGDLSGFVALRTQRTFSLYASVICLLLITWFSSTIVIGLAQIGLRDTLVGLMILGALAAPMLFLLARGLLNLFLPRRCVIALDRSCCGYCRLGLRPSRMTPLNPRAVRVHVVDVSSARELIRMENQLAKDIGCTMLYISLANKPFLIAASNEKIEIDDAIETMQIALPGIGVSRHRLGRRLNSYFPIW